MLFYSMWLFFGCFSLEETEIMGLYHKIVTLDYSFKFKLHENKHNSCFCGTFQNYLFPGGYLHDEARQDVRSIRHSALNRETDISESLNIPSTPHPTPSFEYYFFNSPPTALFTYRNSIKWCQKVVIYFLRYFIWVRSYQKFLFL